MTFCFQLYKKVKENELLLVSYALTYKLLLSIFPFIIFIMTIIGFLDLDISIFLEILNDNLPIEVSVIIQDFLYFLTSNRDLSLLSFSFIVSIYSASTGFTAIITALNKVYFIKDNRKFLKRQISSILLVFVFAIMIILFMVFMVFGEYLKDILIYIVNLVSIPELNIYINIDYVAITEFLNDIFNNILNSVLTKVILFIYLLFTIVVTYKIGVVKKLKVINILPGAIITIVLWTFASKLFNIYIANFSRFSVIYGSIGSIFILLIWLNIIAFVLLLGAQINAQIELNKTKILK
ncbi:MAG: YihY/virulence factor BrkB family protein [bacterium]